MHCTGGGESVARDCRAQIGLGALGKSMKSSERPVCLGTYIRRQEIQPHHVIRATPLASCGTLALVCVLRRHQGQPQQHHCRDGNAHVLDPRRAAYGCRLMQAPFTLFSETLFAVSLQCSGLRRGLLLASAAERHLQGRSRYVSLDRCVLSLLLLGFGLFELNELFSYCLLRLRQLSELRLAKPPLGDTASGSLFHAAHHHHPHSHQPPRLCPQCPPRPLCWVVCNGPGLLRVPLHSGNNILSRKSGHLPLAP